MKTMAKVVSAMALLMVTWNWVENAEAASGNTEASEPQMTRAQFERWKRDWARKIQDYKNTKLKDIAWGKETRAIRSRIIILDPPLAKTIGPDRVQVEWFYTPIDDRGTNAVWIISSRRVFQWATNLYKNRVRYELTENIVGTGRGLTRRFEENRRLYQEMALAWDESSNKGKRAKVDEGLSWESDERSLIVINKTEHGAELMEKWGLSAEEWLKRRTSETTVRRINEINSRYQEIMRQALKVDDDVTKSPMDPILLIDGKYLLAGSKIRKTKDIFRMANWLIREQIERNPRHDFETENILWGNEHKPKRKQVTELRTAFSVPDPNKIDVEWLYTYISEDGQQSQTEWLEGVFQEWIASVRRGGVWDVKLRKTPVSQMSRNGGTWTQHRQVHQRLVLAWDEDEEMRRGWIHPTLRGQIRDDPRSVGDSERAQALVERSGIQVKEWRERMKTTETIERMHIADAKAIAGREQNSRWGRMGGPRSPVIILDGRYLIDRTSAGSVEKVFQILNWIVRLRHQAMTQAGAKD